VAFCRYLVLEPTMSVLIDIGIDSANPTIMMQDYFSFTSTMLFVFGLLFELPVVITFLSILELVTAAFLLKQWRMAVVITFIVAAVLTPPDPLSQTMLAVPMVILYMASIGVVFLIERSRDRRRAQETASA
jgi:sec-independent protein translocase protein TatC